jgi:hypothetical protein
MAHHVCSSIFAMIGCMKEGAMTPLHLIFSQTSQEKRDGQGHATEESDQEETRQDTDGKARRKVRQEGPLIRPALRPV